MSARGVLQVFEDGQYGFWCPACDTVHTLNTAIWTFNGDHDKPTFAPSVLITSGHYVTWYKEGSPCWCTYNRDHPEHPSRFACTKCHSFVTDGVIRYLSDCTHAMAGKEIKMEPYV